MKTGIEKKIYDTLTGIRFVDKTKQDLTDELMEIFKEELNKE
jgi:hypothetical protein